MKHIIWDIKLMIDTAEMDSNTVCYAIYNLLFELFEGVSKSTTNISRFLEQKSKAVLSTN